MKQMKRLLYLIPLVLLLSCGDGESSFKCQQRVIERFPNAKVLPLGDYRFAVIDSVGRVTYVETMGFSAEPTMIIPLNNINIPQNK